MRPVHVEPPRFLSSQYSGEVFRKRMTAALKTLGSKADIVAVDCEEYPCIVYGTGRLNPSDLFDAGFNGEPIGEIGMSVWSTVGRDPSTRARGWAVSVPATGDDREEVIANANRRMAEWRDLSMANAADAGPQ
jgi:hypothetical protein